MAPAVLAPIDPAPELIPLAYTTAIEALVASPLNPRTHFDGIEELAENLIKQGVLVPLLVRRKPGTRPTPELEVVDGERRFRAAKKAGLSVVPVIERDLTDGEVIEIQLLSAIQRQALTPLEEARGYRRLIDSNPAKYSAAYIADRISRSEKYVVDRMRLAQLIPALQQLLEAERIGVAHAELLAKLTPEDQARAIAPGDAKTYGRARELGGLWETMAPTLYDGQEEAASTAADPYAGLKPRTVKELEAWIARHVRFDVAHFAATAPLEFGETAIAVQAATSEPGRGKKVIQITEDYRVQDDVKDPSQRVYGRQAWKRADGAEGTSRAGAYGEKRVDSPTCEHSVLGVVVVGPGYGTAYQVCIARDRCRVHWATEIKEREKTARLRAKGEHGTAAAREQKQRESAQEQARREEELRQQALAAYQQFFPLAVEALRQKLPTTFDRTMFEYYYNGKAPANATPCTFNELLVMQDVNAREPDNNGWAVEWKKNELVEILTHFGVDVKALNKAVAKDQAAKTAHPPTVKAKKAAKTR